MKIKAISLNQPWASMIANGKKTIETRRWQTSYRGDLLICSTKKPIIPGLCCGYALCVVTIWDCQPMCKDDEKAACCELYDGAYAWFLKEIQQILPFSVRGMQGFYEVDDNDIKSSIVNRKFMP